MLNEKICMSIFHIKLISDILNVHLVQLDVKQNGFYLQNWSIEYLHRAPKLHTSLVCYVQEQLYKEELLDEVC